MGNSQEPQDFNISVMPSSLTPVHVAKAAEGLNLYDTASHQVSHFVPLKPGEVGIYVCGATVQSSPHIGHIRAAVAFDIVRRWFLKLGYKVTFVRNVTDIDDKILDNETLDDDAEYITLQFDDSDDIECEILGVFDFEEKEYITLLPQDGTDDVYIYEYKEIDDEEFDLIDIEDDALFERVAAEFELLSLEEE